MKVNYISDKADLIGIASAVLCLIHCLLPPVLFVFFGHMLEHSHEHFFRWDYLFLIISGYAVYHAAQHAFNKVIKSLLWISFGILTLAILFHQLPFMVYLAYLASFGLIGGHIINLRMLKRAKTQR